MVQSWRVDAPFHVRASVGTGRRMPLKVNHVRVIIAVTTAEKMVQSDFIKRRRRSVGGNMAANVWMKAIGLDHHRHGVPTDIALDPPLNFSIAGIPRLEKLSG